jgi:carbonyl reductase 1
MRKVAIVTGANCGIGLAVVRQLCKQFRGDVYLTSRMSDKGKAAVELLRREGLNPLFHELDVSQPDSIRMFEEFIVENYGGVDIIAGINKNIFSMIIFHVPRQYFRHCYN